METIQVSFKKIRKEDVPASSYTRGGRIGALTKQAIRELLVMNVTDVLVVPIEEEVAEIYRKATAARYMHSIMYASKHCQGQFKVFKRKQNIYVEKLSAYNKTE